MPLSWHRKEQIRAIAASGVELLAHMLYPSHPFADLQATSQDSWDAITTQANVSDMEGRGETTRAGLDPPNEAPKWSDWPECC